MDDFKQNKKDIPIVFANNKTPRDIYILYSKFIKSFLGENCFTEYLYNEIIKSSNDIILIDDWRLPIEGILEPQYTDSIKLVKVFLKKEDVTCNKLSNLSNEYENLINENDCDIVLTFNKDWTNTKKLINVIEKFHVIV